ncbi:uncharacterized [Tachysurus ichikawai]
MAHTLMRDRKKEEPGASREEEKEVNVCDGGTLGKIQPARAIVEVQGLMDFSAVKGLPNDYTALIKTKAVSSERRASRSLAFSNGCCTHAPRLIRPFT